MKGQYTSSRNWERIVGAAIVGIALATLFCKADGATCGWNLFDGTAGVVLEVLRPVILAGWQCVPTYFAENARCLQHLPQIVASIWPLLGVIGG
jgi:hypothetical protein